MINASLADSLLQRGVVVLAKESQLIDISLNPAQGSREPVFIKGRINPRPGLSPAGRAGGLGKWK